MAPVTGLKVSKIRLPDLLEQVQRGRIRVPPFHRPFQWEPEDAERLFDSILRGFPIGSLLVWEHPVEPEEVRIGGLLVHADADEHGWSLVDGHQRLSAIIGVLSMDETTVDPRFRIHYDLSQNALVSLPRATRPREDQMPLSVAADNRKALRWQRGRPQLSERELDRCDTVAADLQSYEILLSIVSGTDTRGVPEIFERLNATPLPLSSGELLRAQWFTQLGEWPGHSTFIESDISRSLGFGGLPQPVVRDCSVASQSARTNHTPAHETGWGFMRGDASKDDLTAAISFLREEAAIPHFQLLPHPFVLPALVRFVALSGYPTGRAADLLRRWVWRGATILNDLNGETVFGSCFDAITTNPVFSAASLLGKLPKQRADFQWTPNLHEVELKRPQGRLNVLAMLALEPTLLSPAVGRHRAPIPPGSRVRSRAVIGTLLDDSIPLLQPIIPDAEGPLAATLANKMLHPPFTDGDAREILFHRNFPPESLRAHGLTRDLIDLLRDGDSAGFLAARRELLASQLTERVQRRALWGFDNFGGPATLMPNDDNEFETDS